ncbi:mannose-6-phosphate isomerase, class I [Glutamicibacter sp. JC586]|uniref:mannose-6-phosphate isomerase, class I n=1 Tax=Glutamicibacter sp. JC586 TaxID=2590552 RepID=UPI00135962BD|nr:mannose-6-phosphate isomerase, class I [Glutamicibacter sp. JC586]
MFELNNAIRDYHWGSESEISDLLALPAEITPQAEMWLGAHPGCPSRLADEDLALNDFIAQDPQHVLGATVAQRFGRLPYLFKVLSATEPLSIQTHPTLKQAQERFALENASGKASDAADRNYKDDNHKPEMLYALTDFVALSGFRQPAQIIKDLRLISKDLPEENHGEINKIIDLLQGTDALASTFEYVLVAGTPVAQTVQEICAAIETSTELSANVHFAELVAINKIYPGDPGVLVALLLNLVFLEPGQAISLGAGNVHAYLRGLGIEVMANSDNVLRGGLTSKHIDVPELLDVTITQPSPAPILEPVALDNHDRLYKPEFEEFQLQVLDPNKPGLAADLQLHGAAIVLCTSGEFLIKTQEGQRSITRGQSLFITAAELPASATLQGEISGQLFAVSSQID